MMDMRRALQFFGLSAALVVLALIAGNSGQDLLQVKQENSLPLTRAQPLYVGDPDEVYLEAAFIMSPTFPSPPTSTQEELAFEYSWETTGIFGAPSLRPLILLKARPVGSSGRWAFLTALVDTGADSSLFMRADAAEMGINLTQGKEMTAEGVSGSSIRVWQHELEVVIYCDADFIPCSRDGAALPPMQISVLFPEDDDLISGHSLIGREDVLDNLIITFEATEFKLRSTR